MSTRNLVPNPRHVRCSLFTPSHVNPKTKNLECLHVGLGDKSVKSFNLSLWFRMIKKKKKKFSLTCSTTAPHGLL